MKITNPAIALTNYEINQHLLSQNVESNAIKHIDDLANINSLDELFEDRCFTVLFVGDQNNMGHWVLLSHIKKNVLELFCSFAIRYQQVIDFCDRMKCKSWALAEALQSRDSYICGKYILARINSLGSSLDDFLCVLTCNNNMSADKIIDTLIKIKE